MISVDEDELLEAEHCQCSKRNNGWTKEIDSSWWVCPTCRKPSWATLNDCDTCGRKFKGIRPGLKFAYTCPDCDS